MIKYIAEIHCYRENGKIETCKDCKLSYKIADDKGMIIGFRCPLIGGLTEKEYNREKACCCPLVEVEE